MLSSRHRLPARRETVFTKTHKTSYFVLKVGKNNLEDSCFGFVVSKKVDKRAVIRNQVRRRFQQSIQTLLPSLKQGYDVLFLLSPNVLTLDSMKAVENEVREALEKVSITL